jgi:hypothetical protein
MLRDDEIKPRCPKCEGIEFMAVKNSHVARADLAIAMIVCTNESCMTVVGVLPLESVWD